MHKYLEGEAVQDPSESIRMFSLCEGMKWSHLPVAGGLYDQHPKLLDEWRIIFQIRAEIEAKRAKEDERRNKVNSKSSSRVAGRR